MDQNRRGLLGAIVAFVAAVFGAGAANPTKRSPGVPFATLRSEPGTIVTLPAECEYVPLHLVSGAFAIIPAETYCDHLDCYFDGDLVARIGPDDCEWFVDSLPTWVYESIRNTVNCRKLRDSYSPQLLNPSGSRAFSRNTYVVESGQPHLAPQTVIRRKA